MKRALRRHHVARIKRARRFHWGRDLAQEPKPLAKAIDTPCPCSCWMCGNPRRYFGELTRQEKQELLDFREWQRLEWRRSPTTPGTAHSAVPAPVCLPAPARRDRSLIAPVRH